MPKALLEQMVLKDRLEQMVLRDLLALTLFPLMPGMQQSSEQMG